MDCRRECFSIAGFAVCAVAMTGTCSISGVTSKFACIEQKVIDYSMLPLLQLPGVWKNKMMCFKGNT
jgi:hypothetical protein